MTFINATRKPVFILLISISICSCATLLNSRTQYLTIITSEPSKIVIKNDTSNFYTSNFYKTQHNLAVLRSREPVNISAISQNSEKNVSVKSRNSFAYWLNFYPSCYWLGFLVDRNTPKRYSYPSTIYIDIYGKGNNYLTYKPLDSTTAKLNNIIKFAPLKLVGFVNSGVELSFERKTSNYFATQIMASYLLPTNLLDAGYDYKPNIKGYTLGIEEKLYLRKSAPIGPYFSFNINYLNNNYRDIWSFGIKDFNSDTTTNFTNYLDSIRIHKQTISFNLKFGYQYIKNRFSFDFYLGLGARYKNVVDFDRINPNDEMEKPRYSNFYYITNHNGKYWTVSVPLNFRIGWIF